MGKIKYVTENCSMFPLCAIKDDKYIDYLTNKEITNENTLNFIKKGIERNSLKIRDMDLVIYAIGYINGYGELSVSVYNYQINGCSNYLNIGKQPLFDDKRQYIINKLMSGEYIQKKIWGDEE